MNEQTPEAAVESIASHEDLVRLLAEQYARADLSLRELEARAIKAGGARLPRATCADMLAGRRFPKKAVMLAFLRVCQVPEDRLPAWERAWERLRVNQASFRGDVPGEAPSGGPGAGEPEPVRVRGRRRIALPAALGALVVLVVTVTLGVVIGRQSSGAPDAAGADFLVTDDGRAFGRGGSSRFTVTVDPANTGVRLIRRIDAGVDKQYATITVDGVPAAIWRPLPFDSAYRWRDQVVTIPRGLTEGRRSLTIVNTFVSSSLDFNEFSYFVEQKVDDTWSRADTVDVGTDHTASEAAHRYHITGQTWAGRRTFVYPPGKEGWRVE